jgi:hypothetical protein
MGLSVFWEYHMVGSISNLQRREIQAPVAVSLLRGFIKTFGHDRVMEAASAAIREDALAGGKTMAERYGGNSIRDLLRLVREVWAEDNALEFTLLEETSLKLSFDVTRCRYAEMYERMGIKEFGACLSCSRDEALVRGFNPGMKLMRTRTIMEGSPTCDFRIVLE